MIKHKKENSTEKLKLAELFIRKKSAKEMFKSLSTWSILISNFLVLLIIIIEKQGVLNILWIYWFQSVIIGVFNFFKIISLREFAVDNLRVNNKPVKQSKAGKTLAAVFFLFHYGFFHLVYAVFLSDFDSMLGLANGGVDYNFIILTSLIFFVNYLVEFIFSYKKEETVVRSLSILLMAPYKRIIPMHLTIILSGFVIAGGALGLTNTNTIIVFVFIGIKTIIDLITHS